MTTDTLAKLAAELAQLASEGPALIHLQSAFVAPFGSWAKLPKRLQRKHSPLPEGATNAAKIRPKAGRSIA